MIKRNVLIDFINQTIGKDLLERVQNFDTNCNGIQIFGKEEVDKVALGVSVSLAYLQKAVDFGADFSITHHSLNISDRYIYNSRLDLAAQKRLKFVFANNLTVAAYHAALDIQPEFGNNATIIRLLGAKKTDISFFEGYGWIAEFDKPKDVYELEKKCKQIFKHGIYAVYGGPKIVKRIGVCSGGAKPAGETVFEIAEKGVELHIAGEIAENGDHLALDAGFNYFSCGHYATEVFGVQELGIKIKVEFGDKIEVKFIDIPSLL